MLMLDRMWAAMGALVTAAVLAGCGGGGAGAQGGSPVSSGSEVAQVTLRTSTPSVGSDGRTTATITALVKDASNRAMANQQVDFGTLDAGAALQVSVSRTDASGTATATLQVTEPSRRTIVVTASSGGKSDQVSVSVEGPAITLNGPSKLSLNVPTRFTVSLRDGSGAALSGKRVAIASNAGNRITRAGAQDVIASLDTDSTGQVQFDLTATRVGEDTVTVRALEAEASVVVNVETLQLSFAQPAANTEMNVSDVHPVLVSYTIGGVPQPGQLVQFAATRGTLSATSAVTDGSGRASVSIASPTAGAVTITASVGDVVNSQRASFVSRTPAKISLQPSPASVGVNLSSSSANSSQLIAVVRDANDNPVKGALVSFSAPNDPSNGRIEPAFATTDAAGVATVAFLPGPNSTGNNQIQVRAGTGALSATATLTAAKQELMVRIGTGNQIEVPNITTYRMPWSAVVTDANGNPVSGAAIQASLLSVTYRKGYYVWGGSEWERQVMATCLSEDRNGNLRLDTGEDVNGNTRLDPGNVAAASIVSSDGKTDANGFAYLQLDYPRFYGGWVEVRLRVTITAIAGTEGSDERVFWLPVLAADLTEKTVSPPGQPSPFGFAAECSDPN